MTQQAAVASVNVQCRQITVQKRKDVTRVLREYLPVDLYRSIGRRVPLTNSTFTFDVRDLGNVNRIKDALAAVGDVHVSRLVAAKDKPACVARLVEMHDGGGSPSQRRAFAEQVAAVMASSIRARSRSRSP